MTVKRIVTVILLMAVVSVAGCGSTKGPANIPGVPVPVSGSLRGVVKSTENEGIPSVRVELISAPSTCPDLTGPSVFTGPDGSYDLTFSGTSQRVGAVTIEVRVSGGPDVLEPGQRQGLPVYSELEESIDVSFSHNNHHDFVMAKAVEGATVYLPKEEN